MSKSFVVPSSEVPGYSAIYRHPKYKSGTQNGEYSDITTGYELFNHVVKNYPKKEFLGARKYYPETNSFGNYKWITTTEAAEIINNFGSGLDAVYAKHAPDVNPTTGQQPVGILAINRPEWLLTELAAFRSRRYSVGISDLAGVQSAEFNINSTDIHVVVCTMDKIPRMLDRVDKTPGLKVIVCIDKLDCSKPSIATQAFTKTTVEVLKKRAESLNIALLDMDEVIFMGRLNPTEPAPPKPSDLCTICFTSGTSGAQKGALLTHDAFINATRAAHLSLELYDTTYLSYMSLMHIFDRYMVYTFMYGMVRIGFYSGDINKILDDMQVLHPTVVTVLPMVLNRMYDRFAKVTIGAKGIRGKLSRLGFNTKIKNIRSGRGYQHALWDRLIFNKFAKLFGGNIKRIIFGAAPLSGEVQDFYRVALSCVVIQGYGQTETVAGGLAQMSDDLSNGNIGVPSPGVDVRLRSIPDMGYNVTDTPSPRGELMIRSKILFSGYNGQPERLKEVMDGEWMATGDVAKVNSDGTMTLVDRISNVIKSASAIWVEPTLIEATYSSHRLITSVYVYGTGSTCELVAIVVPEPSTFVPWARTIAGKADADLAELCKDESVAKAMTQELRMLASKHHIPRSAMVGAVHMEPKPLDQINKEFYTATLKIRRPIVNQHFKALFEEMFSKLDSTTESKFLSEKNIK
ncbi:medium-chain fatty acid-CoA ligase faa2 [Coemansia sp. RSA 2703]|nr:medium-chain fatty acid-CoA ligase faa2 [Coemansia sp. RSA 2703]KAJ2377985.1 medium-chain fatty acid-CoA ligase faa2 [Coemansia sp. RSA 2607]KAJ2396874.1 medium-chain fatty acid-CoA ligase faa2 [Coemansia sp. RSA 2603]